MQKKLFLCLSLFAALASVSLAQESPVQKPVAIRVSYGENFLVDDSRPRIVVMKASAVKSSVIANSAPFERKAFEMLNQKRVDLGLKPLTWSSELATVARLHSQDMAEFDFFAHRGLDGKMVSDRADSAHLGKWSSIGENIAFNRGYSDPVAKAVDLWLNSPAHRSNLLSENWKESAVGIAIREDGSYYFTQVFLLRK